MLWLWFSDASYCRLFFQVQKIHKITEYRTKVLTHRIFYARCPAFRRGASCQILMAGVGAMNQCSTLKKPRQEGLQNILPSDVLLACVYLFLLATERISWRRTSCYSSKLSVSPFLRTTVKSRGLGEIYKDFEKPCYGARCFNPTQGNLFWKAWQ